MQVRSVFSTGVLAIGLVTMVVASGCQSEQRPGAAPTTGAGAATTAIPAAKPAPADPSPAAQSAASPAAVPAVASPPVVAQSAASPVASPAASPVAAPALPPTKSDGIYTPTTNREIYQAISADYQEIVALANQVNDGKPLPAAEILKIYEEASQARIGTNARLLGGFAREPARAQEFPEAAQFYGSPTFLDDPVIAAINGAGPAAQHSPEQRSQAIQKGVARIVYHWSRRYVEGAAANLNPGWVDEAWAIYMGKEIAGSYPNSISGIAVAHETNLNRTGSIDVPMRQAMSRAQQAANNKDAAAYQAAANDIYSRFHTIFYLSTVHYLNESFKTVQSRNMVSASAQQMAGLSSYRSIQPAVAKADAAADKTVVAYLTAAPDTVTEQMRNDALTALNSTATAIGLNQRDLVSSLECD